MDEKLEDSSSFNLNWHCNFKLNATPFSIYYVVGITKHFAAFSQVQKCVYFLSLRIYNGPVSWIGWRKMKPFSKGSTFHTDKK